MPQGSSRFIRGESGVFEVFSTLNDDDVVAVLVVDSNSFASVPNVVVTPVLSGLFGSDSVGSGFCGSASFRKVIDAVVAVTMVVVAVFEVVV